MRLSDRVHVDNQQQAKVVMGGGCDMRVTHSMELWRLWCLELDGDP